MWNEALSHMIISIRPYYESLVGFMVTKKMILKECSKNEIHLNLTNLNDQSFYNFRLILNRHNNFRDNLFELENTMLPFKNYTEI